MYYYEKILLKFLRLCSQNASPFTLCDNISHTDHWRGSRHNRAVATGAVEDETWQCELSSNRDEQYCRTGFDSDGLTATKIATENDHYRWNSLLKLRPLYLI